jgi:hypothetical protein
MKLSSFSENIITVPYKRSGETVNLEINIDAFTPEFFRLVGKKFDERMREWRTKDKATPKAKGKKEDDLQQVKSFFENEALSLEIKRQIHAELLASGVLKGWDLTDDNEVPLAPSYDVLVKLPPLLVEDIWNLSLERAKTVKKRVESGTEETLDNTQDGSMGLRVVGQST